MNKEISSTIGQVKAIIEAFEMYANIGVEQFPDYFTGKLLELKELSFALKNWFESGICAKEIRDAVCNMGWKVLCDEDCLIQGNTDEEWALYDVIANLNAIARADECQPTEAQSENKSLDELLAFVPEEHQEKAKQTFERLLQDKAIKRTGNMFEWLKEPKNGLLWYFAHEVNELWGLKSDNDNFTWKPFADLFGIKVARLTEWQSKFKRGLYNKPDGYKYIDKLLKRVR